MKTYSFNPSSCVPFPLGPCPHITSTDGAYCFVTQLAFPGPSETLGLPAWSSVMYFILASKEIFFPNFWLVLILNEFLSSEDSGEISSLSKFVNENLVFPFSLDVDKETVLLKVVPVL